MKKTFSLLTVDFFRQFIGGVFSLIIYFVLVSVILARQETDILSTARLKEDLALYRIVFSFTLTFALHYSFRSRLTLVIDNGFTRLNFLKSEILLSVIGATIIALFELYVLVAIRFGYNATAQYPLVIFGSYLYNFIINFALYFAISGFIILINSIIYRFNLTYLKLPYWPLYFFGYLFIIFNSSPIFDFIQPYFVLLVSLFESSDLSFMIIFTCYIVLQTFVTYLLLRKVAVKPYHNVFK